MLFELLKKTAICIPAVLMYAGAQPVITFTSPALGQVYSPGETVTGALTVENTGGSIDKVELAIDLEDPITLDGPDYSFSFSGLIPACHRLRATAVAQSETETSETFFVVNPEPLPPLPTSPPSNGKLKIFLLAGQSNMEGFGVVNPRQNDLDKNGGMGTLQYLVDNYPDDFGHLVDGGGDLIVRDDVWTILHGSSELQGWHTTGFGVSTSQIGPEYGFGLVMGDFYSDPVLLIKTAWGGAALENLQDGNSFHPPSSDGDTGGRYIEMIANVNEILSNLSTYFPGYDGNGYELVGFGWHQGWNDRYDMQNKYEENLVNLYNDLRNDLEAEDMRIVVANSGFGGWLVTYDEVLKTAQLALADSQKYPEFHGLAGGVETRPFWRHELISPAVQGYHWSGNSEVMYRMGEGMGHAMAALLSDTAAPALTGCMDSLATNYDPAVTMPCSGCCEYTSLNHPEGKGRLSWYTGRAGKLHLSWSGDGKVVLNVKNLKGKSVQKKILFPGHVSVALPHSGVYILEMYTGMGVVKRKKIVTGR